MRSQAQNFTIGNDYHTITPTCSHLTEDPAAILYNNSLNHGIGEVLHGIESPNPLNIHCFVPIVHQQSNPFILLSQISTKSQ